MSAARSMPWLTPALPMMAVLRLGAALGCGSPLAEFLMRQTFLSGRMPRSLRRYTPNEHDVFITTYSKSGTNWAMQIALQIAWRGHAEFGHVHDLAPWPEAPMPDIIRMDDPRPWESPTGLRVIKTHLPAKAVPYAESPRYITVLRDPKEVVVSGYYFLLGNLGLLESISFDEWYQRFCYEGVFMKGWAEHAASFWAWRDRPNVLVLTFGQMKADRPGAVDRFAEVMGVSLAASERDEVIRRASFEYMKTQELKFAPPPLPLRGRSPRPKMMRRGRSGGSGELLSPERQVALDRHCRELLDGLGSDLPYGELFEEVEPAEPA